MVIADGVLSPYARCSAERIGILAVLVSSNPLAFYSLMDLACRTHTGMDLTLLLQLGILVECKNVPRIEWEQLFSTKQHIKAYTSAMASWVKAYIIRLTPVAAAAAMPITAAATEAGEAGGDLQLMVRWLELVLYSLQPIQNAQKCLFVSVVPKLRAEMVPLELLDDLSYSSSNFHIMVLVWISRAVAAMAEQLLMYYKQYGTAAASSSTIRSDPKGKQDMSSSSSSWDFDRGGGHSGSEGSRAARSIIRPNSAISWRSTGPLVPQQSMTKQARAVVVALSLHQRLREWHETATATVDQQSGAAEQHDDTADDEDVTVEASPSSSAPPATSSAAAGAQAAAAVAQLPSSTKFRLPHEGLPAAVVDQLEQLKGRWPFAAFDNQKPVEDQQVQLMVLQDVIRLCKLLQQEVPVPVGCNNPACLNLEGVAEMVTACRTATGAWWLTIAVRNAR